MSEAPATGAGAAARGRRLLLLVLLALSGARLLGFVVRFGNEALQLDLAAYDAAGTARRLGLDPYRTWPEHEPRLFDGKSPYLHSRFLYPPLVASLFAPLSALPYAVVKWIFLAASLLALALATLRLGRDAGLLPPVPERADALLLAATLALSAHPLLTLLERGQVDAFTLLLLVLAFSGPLRGRPPGLTSGLWLAGATLLKLNAVYVVAFWALRRFWRGLLGFALGVAGLAGVSLAVDGKAAIGDYLTRELPRIARYGEDGPPEARLPEGALAALRKGAPDGFAWRDGRLYRSEWFGFAANASLARLLSRGLGRSRLDTGAAAASLATLAMALALVAWALPKRGALLLGRQGELAFSTAVLLAVLLAGPLTWVMNLVWIVPGALLVLGAWPAASRAEAGPLVAAALGLLLAWLPDQHAYPLLLPFRPALADLKYVLAEVLLLAGALGILRGSPTT